MGVARWLHSTRLTLRLIVNSPISSSSPFCEGRAQLRADEISSFGLLRTATDLPHQRLVGSTDQLNKVIAGSFSHLVPVEAPELDRAKVVAVAQLADLQTSSDRHIHELVSLMTLVVGSRTHHDDPLWLNSTDRQSKAFPRRIQGPLDDLRFVHLSVSVLPLSMESRYRRTSRCNAP